VITLSGLNCILLISRLFDLIWVNEPFHVWQFFLRLNQISSWLTSNGNFRLNKFFSIFAFLFPSFCSNRPTTKVTQKRCRPKKSDKPPVVLLLWRQIDNVLFRWKDSRVRTRQTGARTRRGCPTASTIRWLPDSLDDQVIVPVAKSGVNPSKLCFSPIFHFRYLAWAFVTYENMHLQWNGIA